MRTNHRTHKCSSFAKKHSAFKHKIKTIINNKALVIEAGCILVGVSFYSSVFANPEGGAVTAGNAVIANPTPNVVQIQQTSDRAAINWQSFNVSGHETVRFQQPSVNSMTLNRINPQKGASQIYGAIQANGRIILSNPAGIWFGPKAQVNVAGLIATTGNITNASFMSGTLHFINSPEWANSSIINEGQIIAANHGLIALIGANVSNTGLIEAHLGNIVLASGNAFTMHFTDNHLISFSIDEKSLGTVKNTGKLSANGGHILVTAKAAQTVLDHTINMQGIVEAKSVGMKNGEIIFNAEEGQAFVTAKIVASGEQAHELGGVVKILGNSIILAGNASIDVTGDIGGGQILIGGNEHGLGTEMNADYVYVGPHVAINASALTNGDGGKVVIWSNIKTIFRSMILARGGSISGNGGWVETSGKQFLNTNGAKVDTIAPFGKTGIWFMDPANIYIAKSLANANAAGMIGTDTSANKEGWWSSLWNKWWGSPKSLYASMFVQDSLLTTDSVTEALNISNVEVTTNNWFGKGIGNITIVDPFSWNSAHTLTLTAANNVIIKAAIATGKVGSMLVLNAVGNVDQTASISGEGGVTQNGSGIVNLSQNNTYTGATIVNAGTLLVTNKNGLGETNSIIVSPKAKLTLNFSNEKMQNNNMLLAADATPSPTVPQSALNMAMLHSSTPSTMNVSSSSVIDTTIAHDSNGIGTQTSINVDMDELNELSSNVVFPISYEESSVKHAKHVNSVVTDEATMNKSVQAANDNFISNFIAEHIFGNKHIIHLPSSNTTVAQYMTEIAEKIDDIHIHIHTIPEQIKKPYYTAVEVVSPEQQKMLDSVITNSNVSSPFIEKIEEVDTDIIS